MTPLESAVARPWPIPAGEKFAIRSLTGAVASFLAISEQEAPELQTSEGAEGQCGLASNSFLHLLTGLGLDGVNVQLWRDGEPHVVTVCDGWAIDWTYRQFDPGTAYPKVDLLSDLQREGWLVIGHQEPSECGWYKAAGWQPEEVQEGGSGG